MGAAGVGVGVAVAVGVGAVVPVVPVVGAEGEEGGDKRKRCASNLELGWAGGNRQSETSIARRSLC